MADLVRKLITVRKTTNGSGRHIPLNSITFAAFQRLFKTSKGEGPMFIAENGG
jgi:hypothetical protein